MIRALLLGIGGILVSVILFGLFGWIVFNFTNQGELIASVSSGKISQEEFAGSFFDDSNRFLLTSEILILPLIVAVVGGIVGLFSRKYTLLSVLVAICPVFFFLTALPVFRGLLLAVVYFVVSISIAMLLVRRRSKHKIEGKS